MTKAFILDDNKDAVELLRRLLENNYSVDVVGTAADAEAATELIIKTEPDIIFLDIELPTMSGLEFCSLIRQDLKPETKVVFYTGHDKYMLEAIRRQAFDYLLKPPTEQDLSQIMTRYYENKLAGIPSVEHTTGQLPIILVINSMNEHTTLRIGDIAYFRYNQERKIWETVCMNGDIYLLRHRTTADDQDDSRIDLHPDGADGARQRTAHQQELSLAVHVSILFAIGSVNKRSTCSSSAA